MFSDIRYAFRMLLKNPALAAAAVLTLAIGIGANTAIFSLVNAVLLQPLPYPEAEKIVAVHEVSMNGIDESLWMTRESYQTWQDGHKSFEQLAALVPVGFNVRLGDTTYRVQGARVSSTFFSILGAAPAHGRLFTSHDEKQESGNLAVLDFNFWKDNFGSDPDIIGKVIGINNELYTVAGILSKEFNYHYHQDIYIPLRFSSNELQTQGDRSLHVIGRLKPGISITRAQAELTVLSRHAQEIQPPKSDEKDVKLIPLHEEVAGNVRPALILLQTAVGLVLLIVCINITNLLLAHSAARQKEVAVRIALGASTRRLFQQFFAESFVLTFLGGILGFVIMLWSQHLLMRAAINHLPFTAQNNFHFGTFIFLIILSGLTALFITLAPVHQFSKDSSNDFLKSGNRIMAGAKWRSRLVSAEIALSLVLLIGAGLMIKSLLRLQQVHPGFEPEQLLKLRIALPAIQYPDVVSKKAYYDEAMRRLNTLPDVTSVAMINWLPLSRISLGVTFDIERSPLNKSIEADCHVITPQYFDAMKIGRRMGRAFTEQDNNRAPGVIIISENLQRRFFPDQNPIGMRLNIDHNGTLFVGEIVGVVGDVRNEALDIPPQPAIYTSYLQSPWDEVPLREIVVRTSLRSNLAEESRKQLSSINPDVPVYQVQEMTQVMERSMGAQRFNRNLLTFFGLVALMLVIIGVYGLISYSVNQRTRELGVRMALGAQRKDIIQLILKHGLKITVAGLLIGVLAALLLTNLMMKLLYGVHAADPATFISVSVLMITVAGIACYIPARKASKLNPLEALRRE